MKQKTEKDLTSQFSVGCLFAGIGGFAKAFQSVGAKTLWANEKDKFAVETFKLNFPEVRCINKPIEELMVVTDELESVDILTAGFPCQPFSIAGNKKGLEDDRGQLFLHIIRIIREFTDANKSKPKILLLENVRNFRDHDKGRTFQRVQVEIQRAGYWFGDKDTRVLNTATYTRIPQNRERVFMVAFSMDHFPCNTFSFPEPLPPRSLLPLKDFLDFSEEAPSEYYFKPGDRYYPHFKEAVEKGDPDAIFLLRRTYVRQNKSGMCFTLTANMGEGGHNHPVIRDPWGIRKLTPKECARLQGFSDSWFNIPQHMSRSQISKQIGNTITVPLAERLAENCIWQLKNHGFDNTREN